MNKHTKRIFKAKDLCRRRFPYLSALVFSMPCRPSEQCETLAVDQCGRCSFNPEFLDTGKTGVLRGGSFVLRYPYARAAFRMPYPANLPSPEHGFRPVFGRSP